MIADELKREWMALMLRLSTQILIRVHAGKEWGCAEADMQRLCVRSDELERQLLARRSSQGGQGDE